MKAMGSRAERIVNITALLVLVFAVTNVFYAASYSAAVTRPALIHRAHRITEVWCAVTALAFAVLVWRFIVYVRGARSE